MQADLPVKTQLAMKKELEGAPYTVTTAPTDRNEQIFGWIVKINLYQKE